MHPSSQKSMSIVKDF